MDKNHIEELLSCPVCFETLDETNKVLPCQHTFCLRCLENVKYSLMGELHCPECRKVYSGNIKDLPRNIFLNRFIEQFKQCNKSSLEKDNLSSDFENIIESSPEKDNFSSDFENKISLMNGKFSSILNRLRERIKQLPTSNISYSLQEQQTEATGNQNRMAYRNRPLNRKEKNIQNLNSTNYLGRPVLVANRRCRPDGTSTLTGSSSTVCNSSDVNLPGSVRLLRSMYNRLSQVRAANQRKYLHFIESKQPNTPPNNKHR